MSNLSRPTFSGKLALLATIILGLTFITNADANELSAGERAAVEQHLEVLEQHQQDKEELLLNDFQSDLESQLHQAEDEFMTTACAEHQLQFDSDAEVCY